MAPEHGGTSVVLVGVYGHGREHRRYGELGAPWAAAEPFRWRQS